MSLPRVFMSALVSAIALAVMVPAAHAGTYDVLACDAAPGAVNHSWDFETSDATRAEDVTSCPSSGTYSGLLAQTKLNTPGVPVGAFAHWIVRAPSGTT